MTKMMTKMRLLNRALAVLVVALMITTIAIPTNVSAYSYDSTYGYITMQPAADAGSNRWQTADYAVHTVSSLENIPVANYTKFNTSNFSYPGTSATYCVDLSKEAQSGILQIKMHIPSTLKKWQINKSTSVMEETNTAASGFKIDIRTRGAAYNVKQDLGGVTAAYNKIQYDAGMALDNNIVANAEDVYWNIPLACGSVYELVFENIDTMTYNYSDFILQLYWLPVNCATAAVCYGDTCELNALVQLGTQAASLTFDINSLVKVYNAADIEVYRIGSETQSVLKGTYSCSIVGTAADKTTSTLVANSNVSPSANGDGTYSKHFALYGIDKYEKLTVNISAAVPGVYKVRLKASKIGFTVTAEQREESDGILLVWDKAVVNNVVMLKLSKGKAVKDYMWGTYGTNQSTYPIITENGTYYLKATINNTEITDSIDVTCFSSKLTVGTENYLTKITHKTLGYKYGDVTIYVDGKKLKKDKCITKSGKHTVEVKEKSTGLVANYTVYVDRVAPYVIAEETDIPSNNTLKAYQTYKITAADKKSNITIYLDGEEIIEEAGSAGYTGSSMASGSTYTTGNSAASKKVSKQFSCEPGTHKLKIVDAAGNGIVIKLKVK